MTTPTIAHGTRMRVTFARGTAVRVEKTARGRWLHLRLDSGMVVGPIPIDAPDVTAEQLPPVGWPPRPGQSWKDDDGVIWAAAKDDGGDIFLLNTSTGEWCYDLAEMWRERPSLIKVYPPAGSGDFTDEPPF